MTEVRKLYGCMMFENRLLRADGDAFEDLFCDLMKERFPGFQKVKPYGKIGDKKNDGFIEEEGKFYALYGPEDITKDVTTRYASTKAKSDVEGLITNWSASYELKEVFFVVNDKGNGLPAPIHEIIKQLNSSYENIKVSPLTFKDIVNIFEGLEVIKMQKILGSFIPTCDIELIQFDALGDIVQYLFSNWPNFIMKDPKVWKEFDDKIRVNGLNNTGHLLETGSYCVGTVEEFLRKNTGYKVQLLKGIFVNIYEESKVAIPDTHEHYADNRLLYVLEKASPDVNNPTIKNAMIGLLAYFFEKCDIFETTIKYDPT